MYDVIIIGGGPAGLTAAVYCRRAGKTVLVIEKAAFGGQITWSPRVENFPSVQSISGTELGDRLTSQAMDQGAEVELDEVTEIQDGPVKTVKTDSGAQFQAKSVIVATGAKPRELGLPGYIAFLVFVFVLMIALAYLWKRGALDWTDEKRKSALTRT